MTRRTSARANAAAAAAEAVPPPQSLVDPNPPLAPEVAILRRQWKWAAFSQFFITFAPIFQLPEVSITDVEDDLTRGINLVLPRIMQRLLLTLTQDRKTSLDNWQTTLRKQYGKRDPAANPIGPEPMRDSRDVSTMPSESFKESRAPTADAEQKASLMDQDPQDGESKADRTESNENDLDGKERVDEGATKAAEGDKMDVDEPQLNEPDEIEERPESLDWRDLPMLTKLESMHTVMEWHFSSLQNNQPPRIRQVMKSDDEHGSWRIEPVGYDAKTNAYWLIGGDRLWIQRVPPKPSKKAKRKRPPKTKETANSRPSKKRKADPEPEPESKSPSKAKGSSKNASRSTRGSKQTKEEEPTTSSGRGVRAAKLNANLKLDAQAKQLAEFQRQASAERKGPGKEFPIRPLGTRMSSRLRHSIVPDEGEDPEWQPVPDEWLQDEEKLKPVAGKKRKTGLEDEEEDEVSELTDLSEDEEKPAVDQVGDHVGEDSPADPQDAADSSLPDGFVEWETLCVTLWDWDHIAERFEKSTHYLEKALYKRLTEEIVPMVTAEMRELERKRLVEEAVMNRKRSSRIAVKETEKEAQKLAAVKQAEEDEKLQRVRRLEARQLQQEEERLKIEKEREQRRLEREARNLKIANRQERQAQREAELAAQKEKERLEAEAKAKAKAEAQAKAKAAKANGTSKPSKPKLKKGDWMLSCEICRKEGINVDDGIAAVACGSCKKWQHIPCHDLADKNAGRSERDWSKEEFLCTSCRQRRIRQQQNGAAGHQANGRQPHPVQAALPPQLIAAMPNTQPYSSMGPIQFSHYQPHVHSYGHPYNGRPAAQFSQAPYQYQPNQYANHPAVASSSHATSNHSNSSGTYNNSKYVPYQQHSSTNGTSSWTPAGPSAQHYPPSQTNVTPNYADGAASYGQQVTGNSYHAQASSGPGLSGHSPPAPHVPAQLAQNHSAIPHSGPSPRPISANSNPPLLRNGTPMTMEGGRASPMTNGAHGHGAPLQGPGQLGAPSQWQQSYPPIGVPRHDVPHHPHSQYRYEQPMGSSAYPPA